MQNYNDVVNNRFNKENDALNSIYSPAHPIGKYIRKILFKGLTIFLNKYSKEYNGLKNKTLLDVGCGNGGMLDFFISKGFLPQNTFGVDLSEKRINRAKLNINGATFMVADILKLNLDEQKFDVVTSFDLFSHLKSKEQIIQGLSNVYNHLDENGIFLWYDIYTKDHFAAPDNVESWGFNKEQMISFSKESGFECVYYYETFFKSFFNRYHSIYQVKRLTSFIVRILEIILPGRPGNIMIIFKKKC